MPAGSVYGGPDRRRRAAAAFDPLYISRFVWRWRWFVAFTTLAGLGFGIAIASTTPKTYLAATQILLDPRDLKVVQNEVAPNALPSDATLALVESQTAVVMSDRVLSAVIVTGGLADDPEFSGRRKGGILALLPASMAALLQPSRDGGRESDETVKAALRHALTVGREPKSFIINLAVTTESPEKSARVANLFADAFIAEINRIQSDTARRATVALSSRLSELRRAVVQAEGKVEDYKSRNSLIGVNGRLVDDEYVTRINDQLARARGDIAGLRVKAESLKRASVDDIVGGGLPEEVSSEALVRLRQNFADLAQQEASLATQLGPRHPQRIAVGGAMAVARQSIRRELARIVAAGQTELARAEATERDLTLQIADLKVKQIATSESFVKLRELEREVDASRSVYEAFLLRARETGQQESLNTANIRVITEAAPPLRASSASGKLMAIVGAMAGLAVGAGLIAGIAMLRLVIGFVRQDRRGAGRVPWNRATASPEAGPPPIERRETPAQGASSPSQPPAAPTVPAGSSTPAAAPPEGLRSAEPRRSTRPPADMERSRLRDKIREMTLADDRGTMSRLPETDLIQHELRSVRAALAEIRRHRLNA